MATSESATPSQPVPQDFEKLQVAAGLVSFDRALNSTARTVGFYALIFLVFGLVFMAKGLSGWFSLVVGIILLAEAIYLARVRSGGVVLVAGLTLAAFALWLFINFAIAATRHDSTTGRGIVGGFFLAFGAWNLLSSYRSYKLLLVRSDPIINSRVRGMVESLRKCKPTEAQQIIEWRVRGFGENGVWRMLPEQNLFLLAKLGDKTFRFGGAVERALWIHSNDLRLEHEGEKWIGKKLNAKLMIGAEELKISIEPQMLERLEALLMGQKRTIGGSVPAPPQGRRPDR